jgi:hypothetical protein
MEIFVIFGVFGHEKQTQSCLAPSTAGRLNLFEKTNPIVSFDVLRAVFCVTVLSFLWKQESRVVEDFGFRIKCGMTCLTACIIERELKKQTQF